MLRKFSSLKRLRVSGVLPLQLPSTLEMVLGKRNQRRRNSTSILPSTGRKVGNSLEI
jgi:hypothetical protein